MALQVTGTLYSATPIEQKGENFTVRTFVLEITESTGQGQTFTNHAQFQLVNKNCSLIDQFQIGQPITVSFNLRGNFWNEKCITNLNAWKVEAVAHTAPAPQYAPQQPAPQPQYTQPQPQYSQPAPQYAPAQPQAQPQYSQPQPAQYAQPAPQYQQAPQGTPPQGPKKLPF